MSALAEALIDAAERKLSGARHDLARKDQQEAQAKLTQAGELIAAAQMAAQQVPAGFTKPDKPAAAAPAWARNGASADA